MSTRVGTGIRTINNNAELELLRNEINSLRVENEILIVEKQDLEKLPEELSKKITELEKTIEILTAEKEKLEKTVEESSKKNSKKDSGKE